MHRDTVIGIVGVVILVAAMVGVFTYERGQATVTDGTPGGALANFTGPTSEGNVAIGATADNDVVINQTGLTNITFTVTWSPGANAVDTVRVIAQPANDTGLSTAYESEAENDGEIVITIGPLNNTGPDGRLGTGNWRISVEFVSSEFDAGAGPPLDPPDPVPAGDDAIDFAIETQLQAYDNADDATGA